MSAQFETAGKPPATVAIFLYEPGDGGLDRVAILIANGLAERGLATELWLTEVDGPLRALVSRQVRVREVSAPKIGGRGLRLFLQLPTLIRILRMQRPEVLMSAGNQSNLTVALAVILARNGVTRAVLKITNPIFHPGMGFLQRLFRERRFGLTSRLGAQTLTLSQADANEFAKRFPQLRERFRMVHNPYVTAAMLEAGQTRAAAPTAPPQLLAVGRLTAQKDHATLLDALGRLKSRPWTLVILGDGPLAAALGQQAEILGIAHHIRFVGFVADPLSWYAQAQLLILSSRWEGFPAVPIEALACGCNVVTTDCSPGLRELMAAAGLPSPVPVGDAAALARAIESALTKPRPAVEVNRIALRYSLDAAVDDHLGILRNQIGARVPSTPQSGPGSP